MKLDVDFSADIITIRVWEPALERWGVAYEKRMNLANREADTRWVSRCVEELLRNAEIEGYEWCPFV